MTHTQTDNASKTKRCFLRSTHVFVRQYVARCEEVEAVSVWRSGGSSGRQDSFGFVCCVVCVSQMTLFARRKRRNADEPSNKKHSPHTCEMESNKDTNRKGANKSSWPRRYVYIFHSSYEKIKIGIVKFMIQQCFLRRIINRMRICKLFSNDSNSYHLISAALHKIYYLHRQRLVCQQLFAPNLT